MDMDSEFAENRTQMVEKILAKQDNYYRWGFDEQMALERPELTYYWPKYQATLWTLLLLADIQAPPDRPQIQQAYDLITDQFYDRAEGIFSLGRGGHFPIPCLNGNMLYLHFYLNRPYTDKIDSVIEFFNTYQRFDDGDFKTPKSFPYFSNTSCYGKHTCYWGILKLFKGLSYIPTAQRTPTVQRLLERCIEFVLRHEVCFQSHHSEEFLHIWIKQLTFPTLWKSDFLEILWLLAREGIRDKRMERALELLRSKMMGDGHWKLDHPMSNLIIPIGGKNKPNGFLTEKALEVLEFYGQ